MCVFLPTAAFYYFVPMLIFLQASVADATANADES
jgi:hypothetical protein